MYLKKENELNTVISLSVNKYVTFSFKTLHDSSFKPGTNFFLHTLISYIFTVSQILNEFHGRGRSLHSHLPTSSSLYAEHILLLCPSQLIGSAVLLPQETFCFLLVILLDGSLLNCL